MWTMMTSLFNMFIKWLYFEHGSWCTWLKNDYCAHFNDIDTMVMIISSDYEIIRIWKINENLTTKWLMYNDMGNVDHLSINLPTQLSFKSLPTHLPIYLSIHPPTYFYNLPTYYLSSYNLLGYEINMWNKNLTKIELNLMV
jgi:hypothetical protein